jgi:hypothetical protein
MNVLVLTPDGVGSTVLQRISTLALHLNGVEVVNCHELTNGIYLNNSKVYKDYSLEYTQSLDQITKILDRSRCALVSRLAKYHIDNRRDRPQEQLEFYQYLKNFNTKILVCKRKNLFEYAMSWSIRNKSNVFNIYQKKDREAVRNVGAVDVDFFVKKCQEYVDYDNWIHDNFHEYDVVYYEDFALDPDGKIKDIFGIESIFERTFGEPLSDIFKKEYLVSNRKIDLSNKQDFVPLLAYKQTMMSLEKRSVLPQGTAAPIKNTTLQDKKDIVSNYAECRDLFMEFSRRHNWIDNTIVDYDFWNGVETK